MRALIPHHDGMPQLAITFGILLNIVGAVGFFATGATHYTALIPCVLGVILIICGIVALAAPGARKHVMHVAALIGLLGIGGTISALFKLPALISAASLASQPAVISKSVTCILSAVFLALCVKSFIDARRKKPQNYGA